MKTKTTLKFLSIMLILTVIVCGQSNPVVTDVNTSIEGTTVTVTYKVSDAEQNSVTINMKVSNDNGATWGFNYGTASGDIGSVAVNSTPTQKTITWTYSGGQQNFIVMVTADDGQTNGSNCGTVEYEGKTYNTIVIGDQCWLKENLNVGTRIAGNLTQQDNSILEKYCYYDNVDNCNTHGGLYQWNEAMQYVTTAGTKGICPEGWHIPTYAELLKLKALVNNSSNKLKSTDVGTGSGVGTNTSGFAMLMGGRRSASNWEDFSFTGTFWSSTQFNTTDAYYITMGYITNTIEIYYNYKITGVSVRCIKNTP